MFEVALRACNDDRRLSVCQLMGVSAQTPLRLSFSWERFAMRGSEVAGNPDGWGVAYVKGLDTEILREAEPAAGSPLVEFLARHGPESTTIISHVRRATTGNRELSNTQPFHRTLGGRAHVFAHNGQLSSLAAPKGPWLRPIGVTDSEKMFCILLSRLERIWRSETPPSLDQRSEIVAAFAKEMRSLGAANFLYFDGLTLFAHGHRKTIPGIGESTEAGLHLLLRPEASGVVLSDGLTSAAHCGSNAIVATVPLDDKMWRPLALGELLRLEGGVLV